MRDKIIFLVNDAPALAMSINPNSPIISTDLLNGYHDAEKGIAGNLISLANCGKNLTQTPVALIDLVQEKVTIIKTAGRMARGFGETGLYGIRYYEVAVQYVLNMIKLAAK